VAKRGKSLFSVAAVLSSFFGATMIAGAFAYFNYKFSEYKFIDFSELIFYEKSAIFKPTKNKYIVIFYSSKHQETLNLLKKIKLELPIIAIDYYNNSQANTSGVTFLRSGTKTTLEFIQRFNIYNSPSIFFIKRSKENIYKQDSMIRKLDNLKELSQQVNEL
jgi:hypothetical protein